MEERRKEEKEEERREQSKYKKDERQESEGKRSPESNHNVNKELSFAKQKPSSKE